MKTLSALNRIAVAALVLLTACNGRLQPISANFPLTHSLGQFSLGNVGFAQNIAVSSGVSSEGDGLVLYMANEAPGQQFDVLTDDSGHYALREMAGGRCLSVSGGAASVVTCTDAPAQLFTVSAATSGAYAVIAGDGSCLDAAGAWSTVDSSACTSASTQAWFFQGPVAFQPGTSAPPTPPADAGTPVVPGNPTSGPAAGTYQLLDVGFQQNVAVDQGVSSEGNGFLLYPPNSAAGQLFLLTVSGSGYTVTEQAGGRCLDASGTTLSMVTCNGSAEQVFSFGAQAGNAWAINTSAGSCVNGQGAFNTVNVASCSGAPGQLWQLVTNGAVVPPPTPPVSPPPPVQPSPPVNPPSTPVGSLPQSFRLMTLGDSMTGGYDGADIAGYRGPLYNLLLGAGYTPQMVGTMDCGSSALLPTNEQSCDGVGGASIEQTDQRVVAGSVSASNPDVILLLIGFNTVAREPQYSIPQDLGFLRQLVDDIYAQKPTARLIVASMINSTQCCSTGAISDFNAGVPGIVSAKQSAGFPISFVDMYPVVPESGLALDLVHPNDDGYRLIAARWLQAIQAVAGQ